jgi:hypothetical protein
MDPMTADPVRRERRWPPALALASLVALPLALPDRLRLGPGWLLPIVGGLLLAAVVAAGVEREVRVVRALVLGLIAVLVVEAIWGTLRLVDDLVHGGALAGSASELLSTGALIWVNNNIIFGLLYWELDTGGPATRWRGQGARPPDFAFPQHLSPEIASPGWRPVFVDYLYLGLTNAMAFSPTDAMPLASWAKLTMAVQSLVSIAVLGLVIARAVNVMS